MDEEGKGGDREIPIPIQSPNLNSNLSGGGGGGGGGASSTKGKSCKGCLYYSSTQNPNPNTPPASASPKPSNKVLFDKKPAGHTHAPTPAHKSEENGRPIRQPRTYQPAESTRDEYLHRFKRNAALVASGVARNVNRVGNYVKQSVDDILYPYRRRPK